MILRVACRAVARVQRGPPSPDGLWRGSLRYEMVAQPDTQRTGGRGVLSTQLKLHDLSGAADRKLRLDLRGRGDRDRRAGAAEQKRCICKGIWRGISANKLRVIVGHRSIRLARGHRPSSSLVDIG